MEFNDVKALYFDETALREPVYRVKRIEQGSNRFYVAFDPVTEQYVRTKDGSIFFQSVTTFISNSQPTPYGLLKWMADKGMERANYEADREACYGTLLHIFFGEFLINGSLDIEKIGDRMALMVAENGYGGEITKMWTDNAQSDMLALAQWCADYEVTPLAVEITLVSPKMGIAGTLDLFCELNDKCYTEKTEKAKRKRICAIVDLKKRREGFFDEHQVQLEAYRQLWRENFPDDKQPEKIFNLSPANWKKEPGYNFKDQTDEVNVKLLEHFIAISAIKQDGKKPRFNEYKGVITLGQAPAENFVVLGEEELENRLFKMKV